MSYPIPVPDDFGEEPGEEFGEVEEEEDPYGEVGIDPYAEEEPEPEPEQPTIWDEDYEAPVVSEEEIAIEEYEEMMRHKPMGPKEQFEYLASETNYHKLLGELLKWSKLFEQKVKELEDMEKLTFEYTNNLKENLKDLIKTTGVLDEVHIKHLKDWKRENDKFTYIYSGYKSIQLKVKMVIDEANEEFTRKYLGIQFINAIIFKFTQTIKEVGLTVRKLDQFYTKEWTRSLDEYGIIFRSEVRRLERKEVDFRYMDKNLCVIL